MFNFSLRSPRKVCLVLIFTVVLTSLVYFTTQFSFLLRTSLLGFPEHEPFNGTTYPVKLVPDWSNVDASGKTFEQFVSSEIVAIPFYDPSQLSISTDSLEWGNLEDNAIRNAKITYSVPYMGNYLFDGKENVGSHLAVDIKIPSNTPVYAIANGTVIKTSTQSSGFGHHIVIQHNNFPTYDDDKKLTTIYSSYSHLNDVLVSEGTVVEKGERIAISGSTGTATTPHLHFQIDNADAPWHPFWPFTWQEASAQGYDFFSAVNAGLGKEKGLSTTINPVKYVQKYLDSSGLPPDALPVEENNDDLTADSYVPTDDMSANPEEVSETVADDAVVLESEPIDSVDEVIPEQKDPPVLSFEFEVLPTYYVGQKSSFSVILRDQYGEQFKDGFLGDVTISSFEGLVTAKPSIASHFDFDKDGRLTVYFSRLKEGRDKLKIVYDGESYSSDWFKIVDNETTTFSDVPNDYKYADAINYLVSEGVVSGYPDGTFKPYNAVSRVEALKFIFEGIKTTVESGDIPFRDVSSSEWYGSYLYTAYENGVVSGYSDGTFKPTNTVNRAEFYKILFKGMGIDINPVVKKAPFSDVSVDDWFAPYVAYAKKIKILDPEMKQFKASLGMSRAEVAYAIYRLMSVMK